jgi:acyl transferase domain-containing protein/acyl carrier protein
VSSGVPPTPVAIVGIGCRFPGGVTGPASFWKLLSEGGDAITEIPADRIDLGHYFDPRPATPGRMATRWGGFLDGLDRFDAEFFGISPREAERMDPQQRLLLECAWEGFEDAGIDPTRLEGSNTAVFVGQWVSDFESRLFADPENIDFLMTTGSGRYALAGRLSYLLGLRGPSLSLDSACSSSLAAVHLAARAIQNGESDLALAGGVNLILQPHISIAYSQSRMMAPDGRCKFGDADGDGYVRSEGVGLVVLKPLARAQADGDRIYAVLRGSAVNNDGRSSGVMGRPSRVGHEEMLRTAYRDAGLPASRVSYVEAHGTGTRAGDPVEIDALAKVLGEGREAGSVCLMGSVKTNIGHTEGAAGVAGLIKASLALHHQRIPASLHCKTLNPAVAWSSMPMAIAREARAWPRGEAPRFAGVNSFGIGGTNAHAVLEEAPLPLASAPTSASSSATPRTAALLVLSARGEPALRALAARYADRLEQARDEELAAICWNAATRRAALEHRAAFVANGREDLIAALRSYASGEAPTAEGRVREPGRPPRTAFVMPGQGAQWRGMARDLLLDEPVFRETFERCDAAARAWLDVSLIEQLQMAPGSPGDRFDHIDVVQPLLVALALAYAAWWQSIGVRPDAVVGHSMGEVAAAGVAGVLSLDDAMRIICRRSQLMKTTSGRGAMALVDLSMDEAQARLRGREDRLAVAVSNSPRSSVVSGEPAAVQALMDELQGEGVFCRLVKVDVASHSPQMQPLADTLGAELADLQPADAAVALYSTVLARRADGGELGAAYWAANLRQPVRFGDTLAQMLQDGITAAIELGPHPVLLPAMQQTAQAAGRELQAVACGQRDQDGAAGLLMAVGAFWAVGHTIDWSRLLPAAAVTRLPGYPWQRERHWIDAAEMRGPGDQGKSRALRSRHPVLGTGVELPGHPPGALWTLSLVAGRVPAWFEHALHGSALLPASAYLELALAAAQVLSPEAGVTIDDLRFERALHLQPDAPCVLQLQALAQEQGGVRLSFQTHTGEAWLSHAQARMAMGPGPTTALEALAPPPLATAAELSGDEAYRRLSALGATFGPRLQCVTRAWLQADEALVEIGAAAIDGAAARGAVLPPAALDACFQAAVLLAPEGELQLPAEIGRVRWLRQPQPGAWRIHARRVRGGAANASLLDVTLFDAQGPVLVLQQMRLQALAAQTLQTDQVFHEVHWVPAGAPPEMSLTPGRRWCLLADRGGLAPALAAALQQAGETAALIDDPADGDAWPAQDSIELLDLRALDLPAAGSDAHEAELHALVRTAQALERRATGARVRLRWVTRGAQMVHPQDALAISLEQAPAVGLAAVLAVEQGERWGGLVDLDPAVPADTQAVALARQLLHTGGGTLALRGGGGFEPRLRRADPSPGERPVPWRRDATYLVTGGLGGVGRELTRWLVNGGVRHLVVVSRTPLPARSQWASLAADSREGRAVAALRELEALGASVTPVALDVADEAALRDWLHAFEAEARPPIRGVFHAAGLTDDKLVRDLDADSLAAVLRPKLGGALNLHRQLPDLDAFVLFSSMAAVMPQAGQASYAAANAFLDALAQHRRAAGQPALSIGWGVWAQTGVMQGETGRRQQEELLRQGVGAFAPAQALEVLARALVWPRAHVLAMPMDWTRVMHQLAGRRAPLLSELLDEAREHLTTEAAPTASAAPALSQLSDPAERRRALELAVREVVGRVLKLPLARIDPRKPLGNMGLTSLMALELRNRLEPIHGKPLSATLAWNYPTVEALTAFLAGEDAAGAAPAAPAAPPVAASGHAPLAAVLGDVDQLSDDDAALLLRKRR